MKKLNLLFILLGMTAIGFMSSCDSTDEPGLGEDLPKIVLLPNGDITAIEGSSVTIEATLTENVSTKSVLKTFAVDAEGTANDTLITYPNNTHTASYSFTVNAPLAGQQNTVTFTLTDKAGKVATKTVKITGESSVTTTDLSTALPFEWKRVAGAPGTGLEQFGLKWTSNNSQSAIIKGDADKLVALTTAEWTSIVTKEDLEAAVTNGNNLAEYTGVGVVSSDTYNDVLATKKGNDYFLIRVTKGTVSGGGAGGTTIVITGEYKQ